MVKQSEDDKYHDDTNSGQTEHDVKEFKIGNHGSTQDSAGLHSNWRASRKTRENREREALQENPVEDNEEEHDLFQNDYKPHIFRPTYTDDVFDQDVATEHFVESHENDRVLDNRKTGTNTDDVGLYDSNRATRESHEYPDDKISLETGAATAYKESQTLDEGHSETEPTGKESDAKHYVPIIERQSIIKDYKDEHDFFPYENHPHIYRPTYIDDSFGVATDKLADSHEHDHILDNKKIGTNAEDVRLDGNRRTHQENYEY